MTYKEHFTGLWAAVREMGAEYREHQYQSASAAELDIDAQLESGHEITDLSELNVTGGVLSIQGRQVLLYIPDQGRRIREVLADGSVGRRFHVADCVTLQEMRSKGRFERYTVTNRLNGIFDVSGVDFDVVIEGQAKLKVCKNCLKYLNYKGYRTTKPNNAFSEFTIEQFFESYSTFFRHLPGQLVDRKSGYAEGWSEISARTRSQANWTCQQCSLQLQNHRHLLHVHHIDGNKQNNKPANLKALCADCHRKQPMHESMFIKPVEMADIQRLRREQGIQPDKGSWQDVYKYVDTAYEGVARILEQLGSQPPEIGYDIEAPGKGVVLNVELAWPAMKKAVVRDDGESERLKEVGWLGITIGQLLSEQVVHF